MRVKELGVAKRPVPGKQFLRIPQISLLVRVLCHVDEDHRTLLGMMCVRVIVALTCSIQTICRYLQIPARSPVSFLVREQAILPAPLATEVGPPDVQRQQEMGE